MPTNSEDPYLTLAGHCFVTAAVLAEARGRHGFAAAIERDFNELKPLCGPESLLKLSAGTRAAALSFLDGYEDDLRGVVAEFDACRSAAFESRCVASHFLFIGCKFVELAKIAARANGRSEAADKIERCSGNLLELCEQNHAAAPFTAGEHAAFLPKFRNMICAASGHTAH